MGMPRLQVVGGGRMGEALLAGLVAGGWAPVDELRVVEKLPDRAVELRSSFPGLAVTAEPDVAHGHVLAVKPGDVDAACGELAATGSRAPVLSIAAGVTIERLEAALPAGTPVVRAMPNTPAAIGEGITALFANRHASERQKELCAALMAAVGQVLWLDDEEHMHAITAMSGGGPAYVFLLIEVLAQAAVRSGLPEALAWPLARATVAGSGALAAASGRPVEELRQNVTSPGGTTQAALGVLMAEDGIQPLFDRAIAAGTQRSRELA
jgi:pyrroline-5-carboxylate reductase